MGANDPFGEAPPAFDDDPRWWRARNQPGRAETAFSVNPWGLPPDAPRRPYEGQEVGPYERPGDPLMGTSGLERQAEALGKAETWTDRLVEAAGLIAGIAQGKVRKGSQGKPLPENVGIPREQRPGVRERGPSPGPQEPAPRQLDAAGFYDPGYQAVLDSERTQGTGPAWYSYLKKQGVKDANIDAVPGLRDLLASNQVIPHEQLRRHWEENRPKLQETRYGGEETEPNLRRMSLGESDREGNTTYEYEDRNSGHRFTVTHDHDAGNVYVQGPGGRFLPIDAPMNKQSVTDAEHAMGQWLRKQQLPKDVFGPLRYPQESLALDDDNPSNRELVLKVADRAKAALAEYDAMRKKYGLAPGDYLEKAALSPEDMDRLQVLARQAQMRVPEIRSGHFPHDVGYVSHLRTSLEKDQAGDKTLLINEAQADPAQRIRDNPNGARDEAKIKALKESLEKTKYEHAEAYNEAGKWIYDNGYASHGPEGFGTPVEIFRTLQSKYTDTPIERPQGTPGVLDREGKPVIQQSLIHMNKINKHEDAAKLLEAELRDAEMAPVGHSLVNDMGAVNRRMMQHGLIEAVRQGANSVSITPGDLQNERYNLAKYVSAIRWNPETGGLHIRAPGENLDAPWSHLAEIKHAKDLPSYIGKEMSEKLLAAPTLRGAHSTMDYGPWHTLEELGSHEIGGQGMRDYYDRQYPETMAKELKRLDPQWPGRGTRQFWAPAPNENVLLDEQFHYFPLTPKIVEEVKKGLPLFSAALLALAPSVAQQWLRPRPGDPGEEDAPDSANPFGKSLW